MYVDGGLGLGHRRLAVIDPSPAGDQPMSYGDGRWWATFNGEIYNFIELRAELESLGHRFKSRSDCEVLLAAFAEWGADCQLRFNGMWAFAIWDVRAQTLFISRDRFGVKPLFYVNEPHRFAFASELKAFLSLAAFDPCFDPQAVANKLHDLPMIEAAEASLLQGVHKLAAGHCLWLRRGDAPTVRRWWKTLDHLQPVPARYEEQVEAFRSVFFDACRVRTRSDRQLGTTLSGGLDSSSILCALSRLRSDSATDAARERPIHSAVHMQFPESATDESGYAVAAAGQAHALLRCVPLEATQVLAEIDDVVFAHEGISTLPSVRWFTYRALRRLNVAVAIDGDGADELLAGYTSHFDGAVRSCLMPIPNVPTIVGYYRAREGMSGRATWRDWRALSRLVAGGYKHVLLRDSAALQGLRRFIRAAPSRRPWLTIAPTPTVVPALHQDLPTLSTLRPLQRELYQDFHYGSLPGILRAVDRCSMAHGVEVRSPFLDWRVVCLSFSLPETSKLGAGVTKRILRSAMAGILPSVIANRTSKIPFTPPVNEWLRGPMRAFLLDTINSQDFLQSSIWSGHDIRTDVEAALRREDLTVAAAVAPFVHAARLMQVFEAKAHAARRATS